MSLASNATFIWENVSVTFVALSTESWSCGSVTTSTVLITGNCVSNMRGKLWVNRFPEKSTNVAVIVYVPSAVPFRGIDASVLQVN